MRTVKQRSQKQESMTAKDLSGKTVPASGAKWGAKGDVRSSKYLVECKTTKKPFYSLNLSTWKKIDKEALHDGMRLPVMRIDLSEGYSESVSFAVVSYKDFQDSKHFKQATLTHSTLYTGGKSHRITKPCNFVISLSEIPTDILTLSVIEWADFLEMTKED